jgi:hypothetical protein
VHASDVDLLNAPHGGIIEISSSSYGLSLFSSKAGSDHDMGAGAVLVESSSVSIGYLWPEINNIEGACGGGASVNKMRDHLEASTLHPLFGTGGQGKGK